MCWWLPEARANNNCLVEFGGKTGSEWSTWPRLNVRNALKSQSTESTNQLKYKSMNHSFKCSNGAVFERRYVTCLDLSTECAIRIESQIKRKIISKIKYINFWYLMMFNCYYLTFYLLINNGLATISGRPRPLSHRIQTLLLKYVIRSSHLDRPSELLSLRFIVDSFDRHLVLLAPVWVKKREGARKESD